MNTASNVISPFVDTIQDCHLHQHVLKPTRYREGNKPSLLDLIFTNEEGMIQTLQHSPGLGDSDHECIDFTLNCYKNTKEIPPKLNFFKADYIKIRERLKGIDWSVELRGDFLTAYTKFSSRLESSKKGCVPCYGKAREKKSIYLTSDAIRLKDNKNKLWRLILRN